MQDNQKIEEVNKKYSVLFFLEGITVMCFLLIVLAFTIPSTVFAMNMIIGAIVVASFSSIGILAFANKRIGVERGLFKLPVAAKRAY